MGFVGEGGGGGGWYGLAVPADPAGDEDAGEGEGAG